MLGLAEVGYNGRSPGGLRTVLGGPSRARRRPPSRWWWLLVPLLLLGLLLWLLWQQPQSVAEAELSGSRSPTPIGILLLLDESGSFQQYRGIRDQALADVLRWCAQPNNLRDDDTITVVAFTNQGLVRMPSTRVADIRAGKAQLDSTPLPGDSTEVQPALTLAASAVDSSMPQSLVAVTDTAVYDLDTAAVERLVRALNVTSMSLIVPDGVKVKREWGQLFGYEHVVRASSDSASQTSLADGRGRRARDRPKPAQGPLTMIESLILLAAVIGICLLIISGSRPRRGETTLHARHFSFLRRYADRSLWPSLIVGAIAAGTLTAAGAIDAGGIGVGLVLGLTCAVLWRLRLRLVTEWGLALISLAAAIVDVIGINTMPVSAATERWYGYLLLSLLTSCYIFGLFRSGIVSALSPRRILIYFAAADVVVFMVSPAGAQIPSLPLPRQLVYVAVTCAVAFLLGALSVDIITVLAAASVTVTALLLAPAYFSGRLLVVGVTLLTALLITRVGRWRRDPSRAVSRTEPNHAGRSSSNRTLGSAGVIASTSPRRSPNRDSLIAMKLQAAAQHDAGRPPRRVRLPVRVPGSSEARFVVSNFDCGASVGLLGFQLNAAP